MFVGGSLTREVGKKILKKNIIDFVGSFKRFNNTHTHTHFETIFIV